MQRQTDENVKKAAQMMLEQTVMDISERLNATCTAKCTKPVYASTELVKDEAVCLDRCVAKYLDLHELIGKRLQEDKNAYRLLAEKPYLKSENSET